MNDSKISVRYAKALFLLAQEKQMLERVKDDIIVIKSLFDDDKKFELLLENPVLTASEKHALIDKLFKPNFHQYTLSFLHLMVKNRRETHLQSMTYNFLLRYRQHQGIKEAELITAVPLSNPLKQRLIGNVGKHYKARIELEETIDESIIGGFILRVEDQQIDASVSGQLKAIKQSLLETNV